MPEGRFEWHQFSEIETGDDLDNYIKYKPKTERQYDNLRAYSHDKFFHYTKMTKADKILDGQNFLFSKFGSSNDPMETNVQDSEGAYVLCFATGKSEIIPMWYLYSGVDGKGCCLSFRKTAIYDLIHKSEFSFCVKDEDGTFKKLYM